MRLTSENLWENHSYAGTVLRLKAATLILLLEKRQLPRVLKSFSSHQFHQETAIWSMMLINFT